MMGVTARQRDCLQAIETHVTKTGLSPTIEELRSALNLRSKGRVVIILDALVERGFIGRTACRARSIRLLQPTTTSFALPANLEASLRRHCQRTGDAMSDVVTDAVALFLDESNELEDVA